MHQTSFYITRLWFLIIAIATSNLLFAQVNQQKLLLRDSLDYKDNKITINTNYNEFSPIPYKGGLLYVSNKPSLGRDNKYNRVYWSSDPKFKIIEAINVTGKNNATAQFKITRFGKTDDFTAPTSNDNDILYNYRTIKKKFNKIEQSFLIFSTDQAFDYDDSAQLIVYAKKRKMIFGGVPYWRLWQANVIDGRMRNKQRIRIKDKKADYLYPFIDQHGARLYFASNRKGGKGGFDIYYVNKEGDGFSSKPISVNELNSVNDDISYFKDCVDVYFSSNRPGGLGGFDAYTLQNNIATNLGYPLNTAKEEVSLHKFGKDFFLTTNRLGNFDVYGATYEPIYFTINGLLLYRNDSTIVPNHKMYYKDADTGIILDTLFSNANGKYTFTGKPNRNYTFTTLNGDNVEEYFSINTVADQKTFDYITYIGGKSPKQLEDSIQALLAANEKRRLDSIEALGITTKFVVHYGFDKSIIEAKEELVLNYLLSKLKQLPNTYISIGAFTDCIGSNSYNYNLSVKRAKAVYTYLVNHGLSKQQILTNGYAKKFNIAPCIDKSTTTSIKAQIDNRRAEIVLSNVKNQDWESLEKTRGAGYYEIFNASSKLPTKVLAENTAILNEKGTNKKVIKYTSKQVAVNPSDKKDNELRTTPIVVKVKDSIQTNAISKNTSMKEVPNTEISKEEILKALDSLTNLKLEQERIVAYLTLRINKKPIDIFVSSDSVMIELYDNGAHDLDSVSLIYNKRIVVNKQELKVNHPIQIKLKVDTNMKNNELIMVAENLGTEPPNTAVMFITEKSGKRQQVILNTDMTHNGVVYFIRIGKQQAI